MLNYQQNYILEMLTFTLRYAGVPYLVNATNSPITNQVITIVARERCYISVEERSDKKLLVQFSFIRISRCVTNALLIAEELQLLS